MILKKHIWIVIYFIITTNLFSQEKYLTKDGTISFFSHTPVEDIKASNNQVLCILDTKNGTIASSILIKSFVFKKALMQEHFNENYMESDKYPKAVFSGKIKDFNTMEKLQKKVVIEGDLTIRGITKKVSFDAIYHKENSIKLKGHFYVKVNDFNIRIPAIVSKNIAKEIKVNYHFLLTKYKN